MIAPPRNAWLSQDRLSKTLPQTLLRRLKFVDSHAEHWDRVLRYLEPIFGIIHDDDLEGVRQLAVDLYELCLGAQLGAEIDIDPADDIDIINTLLEQRHVRDEARARLVVLRGLFAGAERLGAATGLQGVPGSAMFVSNTIDEILDDAEFLQASALRRWFSVSSNKRAVSRDLRRVVNALTQKKRWAQSLVAVSKSLVGVVAGRVGGSDAARELVRTVFESAASSSVVIAPQPPVTTPSMVVQTVRAAKHDDQWCLWIHKLETGA